MGDTTKLDGKSSINVKWLTMWQLKTDAEGTTPTYDETPHTFPNQLNSVKYSPSMQTNEQYGDGIKVEDYVAKDGGDIEAVIRGFTEDDNEFLFGETTKNGISVSTSEDIVPSVCTAYATERADGLLNLYKFPKVKWMPQGEDSQQRTGTQVNYGTAQIKGSYSPLLSTHEDSYKKYGVDPNSEEGKKIIEKWFADALPDLTGADSYSGKASVPVAKPNGASD